MITHYQALGLDRKCGAEDIRRAYIDKCKTCHPDVQGGNVQDFQLANDAYKVLGDVRSRTMYDAWLNTHTKCRRCDGDGWLASKRSARRLCPECNGNGVKL